MRRKDREIKDFSKIVQIIRELPIGHLAMIDGDQPYGVTMNYDAEEKDGIVTLYFHGAKEGRRPEIWKRTPSVAVMLKVSSQSPSTRNWLPAPQPFTVTWAPP